jgi:GntR family transcriptional regulator
MLSKRVSMRPLYLQIRDILVERISTGEWAPGGAIPNETDLARSFGVSTGTVRKALELMEGERLLTRRQGRGTFVNNQSSDELAMRFDNLRTGEGQYMETTVKTSLLMEAPADAMEQQRLALGASDLVLRLRHVHAHKDRPLLVEETALPAELFPGLGQKQDIPHRIGVLAQLFGILPGKANERIDVRAADADIAAMLSVPANSPILYLDRVVLSLDGRPIQWRKGYCNLTSGDHYFVAFG